MEPKFENGYTMNHKMIAEFARKYSVGPRRLTLIITVPIMILCSLFALSPIGDSEMRWRIFWLDVILGAIFFLPEWYAWMVLRNSKKQNDGVLPDTIVHFADENIQMFEGMVHLTIEYRKIIKAVRLKHSYALFNGKRTAVLIDPDGFTLGDFETFKRFLREKCPGIKIDE